LFITAWDAILPVKVAVRNRERNAGAPTKMIASLLIIAVSGALFAYWFRYTCVLILNTKTSRNYSPEIAAANGMSFLHLQEEASTAQVGTLVSFLSDVENDYRKVSSLLDNRCADNAENYQLERALLGWNFRWMKLVFRFSVKFSERTARAAFLEMTQIVEHHANALGEVSAMSRA
jgi:hypothetical protein